MTVGPIEVKPFTAEHLGAASNVFVRTFAADPWNEVWPLTSARRRISNIAHAPGFVGFASFREGDLIGFVLGRLEPYCDEEHFHLQEMCVAPEFQRRGIGRLMLQHLHGYLVSAGCKQVYLITARESRAEHFYTQNGYRQAQRAGVMVRRLA